MGFKHLALLKFNRIHVHHGAFSDSSPEKCDSNLCCQEMTKHGVLIFIQKEKEICFIAQL